MMPTQSLPAPVWRRLFAALYDILICICLVLLAGLLYLALMQGHAESLKSPAYMIYQLSILSGYFILSWHFGGQTLGMRPWRLHLLNNEGHYLSWKASIWRYLIQMLTLTGCGIVFLTTFTDRNKRALHDILSRSRIELRNTTKKAIA